MWASDGFVYRSGSHPCLKIEASASGVSVRSRAVSDLTPRQNIRKAHEREGALSPAAEVPPRARARLSLFFGRGVTPTKK